MIEMKLKKKTHFTDYGFFLLVIRDAGGQLVLQGSESSVWNQRHSKGPSVFGC